MFLTNKYTKWYFNIIQQRKENPFNGYTEQHHIIPKKIGGSNDKQNLVRLTAREHYVCHLLLVKMLIGNERNKMICAIALMSKIHRERIKTSRIFAFIREAERSTRIGKPRSAHTRALISKARLGKKLSEEHKTKLSESHKGFKRPESDKEKISKKMKELFKDPKKRKRLSEHFKEKPLSEETKMKMSIAKRLNDEKKKLEKDKLRWDIQ